MGRRRACLRSARLGLRGFSRLAACIRFLGAGGLDVDATRQLSQLLVCLLLFLKSLPQERHGLVFSENLCVSADTAVTGDFVVLHPLSGGDKPSIQFLGRGIFRDQIVAFFDEALHALTFLTIWAFSESFENLFEACDVFFGLLQVPFKTRAQVPGS